MTKYTGFNNKYMGYNLILKNKEPNYIKKLIPMTYSMLMTYKPLFLTLISCFQWLTRYFLSTLK